MSSGMIYTCACGVKVDPRHGGVPSHKRGCKIEVDRVRVAQAAELNKKRKRQEKQDAATAQKELKAQNERLAQDVADLRQETADLKNELRLSLANNGSESSVLHDAATAGVVVHGRHANDDKLPMWMPRWCIDRKSDIVSLRIDDLNALPFHLTIEMPVTSIQALIRAETM
jgi:hypothetical protein